MKAQTRPGETAQRVLDTWSGGRSLPGVLYRDADDLRGGDRSGSSSNPGSTSGTQARFRERGDYFLFDIAGESVIVVRDGEGQINALLNVCRHRGSRICDEATGRASRLVCRYHGWTYGLDGSLRAAGHTPAGFDRTQLGLRRLQCQGVRRADFHQLRRRSRRRSRRSQRIWLRRSLPIARAQQGRTPAKLSRSPATGSSRSRTIASAITARRHIRNIPSATGARFLVRNRQHCSLTVMARAPAAGLTQHEVRRSWLDARALGVDRGFERYPLLRGHQTGSRDGKPVAPFLGTIKAYDGGATDLHLGPMTFGLAYCDHVVLYRFTPRGLHNTDCEITWLVNESAVEGKDYDRAALTWLWDVTTIADKEIIERNQLGVDSRFYEPGPLSPMEDFTLRFLQWYVATMRGTNSRAA